MPPDTAALKYWLDNRQPDRWREQPEDAPAEREPLEIHVTVEKPVSDEVPEEYLIADEGQEDALDRLIRAQDEALADSQ